MKRPRMPITGRNSMAEIMTVLVTVAMWIVGAMGVIGIPVLGIGLAASQVNVHERVVVIDVSEGRDQPLVLINPEIIWSSPETQVNDEGCLSVPGVYDGVERASAIKVRALDLQGQPQTHSAEGLLAVCVQHEMDHLMGKVFVEYLSPLKRNRIKTKMIKQKKDEERV